jgi:hypothetical protein
VRRCIFMVCQQWHSITYKIVFVSIIIISTCAERMIGQGAVAGSPLQADQGCVSDNILFFQR